MKKNITPGFPFNASLQKIRRVRWENLPIGSIILEWTQIHGASIPELIEYPVITARLRTQLQNRYQFLTNTKVTIADPDSGIGQGRVIKASRDAMIMKTVLPEMEGFRQGLRRQWMAEPEMRQGLSLIGDYDKSPYMLTKNWARSIGSVVRDDECFGSVIWGPELVQEPVGTVIAKLLSSEIFLPEQSETAVHLGLDVSFSMTHSGKTEFIYKNLLDILAVTAGKLKTSTWNLWLLSDSVTQGNWQYALEKDGNLEAMLKRQNTVAGNTYFSPFFKKVLERKNQFRKNLCILITDGICQDRPAALRAAEKMAENDIDYLQLVLHQDEEYRDGLFSDHSENITDGLIPEELITDTDTKFTRTDDDLKAYCNDRIRDITDIAEAARGGQLILTWYPLFSYLALDVYGRWLGGVATMQH